MLFVNKNRSTYWSIIDLVLVCRKSKINYKETTGVCTTEYLTNLHVPYLLPVKNGRLTFLSIAFYCIFSSWGYLELDMVDLTIFLFFYLNIL